MLCQIVNSGSGTPVDLDPSTVTSGWGNNPPPDWAAVWQVLDNGNGTFLGVGWLGNPPYYGGSAEVEIGVAWPPAPPTPS